MQDVLQLFLPRSGIYLLVFSMLRLRDQSTQQTTLRYLSFWLDAIHLHAYDSESNSFSPVLLVGTRKDEISDIDTQLQLSDMLVDYFEKSDAFTAMVKEPCASLPLSQHGRSMCFFPVDNRHSRSDGIVDQLREAVDNHVRSDPMGYTEKQIPISWLNTCDRMREMGAAQMGRDQVSQIAKDCGVFEHTAEYFYSDVLSAMLVYFHSLGVLVYYDEPALRQDIVLQPQYLVDRIGCVIRDFGLHRLLCLQSLGLLFLILCSSRLPRDKQTKVRMKAEWNRLTKEGLLKWQLLQYLWSEDNDEQQRYLLGLLDRFGLVCPIPGACLPTTVQPTVLVFLTRSVCHVCLRRSPR